MNKSSVKSLPSIGKKGEIVSYSCPFLCEYREFMDVLAPQLAILGEVFFIMTYKDLLDIHLIWRNWRELN